MSASTPAGRGVVFSARHSLRTRLPLLISALVVVVLAAFLWVAYREVEATLLRAAGDRARTAADQLATLLERSIAQGSEQLRRVAGESALRECLKSPTPRDCDAAQKALAPLAVAGPRRIALWTAAGSRVVEIVVPVPTGSRTGLRELPVGARPVAAGIGRLQAAGEGVFLDSIAEVREGDARLGYLAVRSTVSINPPGVLGRMAGDDAIVEVGNRADDVWTDLSKIVPAPRADVTRDAVAEYVAADGVRRIGSGRGIRETPWAAWVGFPRSVVIAPARAFLERMILLGIVFALGAALLVRALTVRVTTPLSQMTGAAEAIAAGNYSRRVPAERRDEIGRLGSAFNTMTSEIERAHRGLAYLAAIVENSDDAIIGETLDGIVQSWNRGAERLYGYSAGEMIGRSISIIITRPDELPRLLDRVRRGDRIPAFETVRVRKDGAHLDVALTMSPIRDATGKILGASTVARHISERKKLEEQLRQAQKMEAIGQLAGGVAHDFNNLLTAILGYGELLTDSLEPTDARRLDIQEIVHAAQRAAGLTRQLLAFSRKQVFQPELVNLNTLVTDTSQMLRRLIGEHIQLETKLAPDLAAVRADPTQLHQIVINLAVNARDAMPGGGRLSIETANVNLDESSALQQHIVVRPGPYVMLAVTDTGVGMNEETRRRLFEPFFTTKERGRGTGLGLATVYAIVKESSGYVWVYSEPERGAAFKVYLPRAEGEVGAAVEAVAVPEAAPVGSETVLLVEDEQAVRFFARALLERAGYRVFEAGNPQEADTIFEGHADSIDMLITDVVMPGSTGPALFERLTRRRPRLKVLYMSGYTDDAIMHGGQPDPGAAFVQKPFAADRLMRKVREVLDRSSPH